MQGAEGLGVLSTFETQKSRWPVQPGGVKVGTGADPLHPRLSVNAAGGEGGKRRYLDVNKHRLGMQMHPYLRAQSKC